MLLKNLFLVGFGGMIGSMFRYVSAYLIKHDSFPLATFTVNIAGSLLMGFIMGIAVKQEGFANWRLFLASGVCGGYTTFSAFAWENMQFLHQHRIGAFIIYTFASLIIGLTAVTIGYWLTK